MCVHAHPDDEAISTGGVLARYGAEGIETVLVTCTNGELGDGPGGVKPGEPGHTDADVASRRARELAESCAALGIEHAERLGYRDSGMAGWSENANAEAFSRLEVGDGVERLAPLLERYRPQVVVTYDENGFYGHPDHIQAHRVTVAAMDATGIGEKLYYPAVPLSAIADISHFLTEHGVEVPLGLRGG
ncbi:MAG: PIG-L family deacetylase, partial [Gaiellaceae bacterium]